MWRGISRTCRLRPLSATARRRQGGRRRGSVSGPNPPTAGPPTSATSLESDAALPASPSCEATLFEELRALPLLHSAVTSSPPLQLSPRFSECSRKRTHVEIPDASASTLSLEGKNEAEPFPLQHRRLSNSWNVDEVSPLEGRVHLAFEGPMTHALPMPLLRAMPGIGNFSYGIGSGE